MPKKKSYVDGTDLFCGAGGMSTGLVEAGVQLKMAINHWQLAIETHNTNHPGADHHCYDISRSNPHWYPSTTLLAGGPSCTAHTLAKGVQRKGEFQLNLFEDQAIKRVDPAAERSRSTMWNIVDFAEVHDYDLVIIENVIDAGLYWRPFKSWLLAMDSLGYDHQFVNFNSMFAHPTPQSRDRLYIVFHKKRNPKPDLDIRPLAHCQKCAQDVEAVQCWKNKGTLFGKYRKQYEYCCPKCAQVVVPYYHCAANAIDWDEPIQRIGDRNKPLSANTLNRIRKGLERFGIQGQVVDMARPKLNEVRSKTLYDPIHTQTTTQNSALFVPPFVVEMHGTSTAREITQALSTISTSGSHHGLCIPFLASYYGSDNVSDIQSAIPTITTKDRHGVVVPPFIMGHYTRPSGKGVASSEIIEPMPTLPAQARHCFIEPGEEENPKVEDCGYRMLKPHEIQAGMGFESSYKVLGTGRQKVRQLGNAVTPPVAQLLAERCIATLAQTSCNYN